ncbi:EscU/YscU/HrcU family type III secretion system export apparatus switch protein [Niveispirillum fermenti]|uniref:EscU/YscU/HrcU family type III secretion system export apparatus switch protein n=1 Tax=Niveispirillum fermenti TaxID=1233113 RepID=UPI003A892828
MSEQTDDSQKTEEPTQRKLDEARRRGDLPVSREAGAAMVVLAALIMVGGLGPSIGAGLAAAFLPLVENPGDIVLASPPDAFALMAEVAAGVGLVLLPVAGLLLAAGFLGAVGQGSVVIAAERIQPKLNRLSPLGGLKRLFSLRNLVEFLKGLGKVAAVTLAFLLVVAPMLDQAEAMALGPPAALPLLLVDVTVQLLLAVLAASIIIAVLDLLWQRLSWRRQQRMSMQELKEEFRQAEGDPHLKAKIKQLRRDRARNRMFAELPNATVVITNPTHYAVALRYDLDKAPAPVCVAKGRDLVALRIREVAATHAVPVVENPPLARALHAGVEIGDEVQPEHYVAVAELIAYVLNLKARNTVV